MQLALLISAKETISDTNHWLLGPKCGQKSPNYPQLLTSHKLSTCPLPTPNPGQGRIPRRRGNQHTNLPDFPKNCMKLRTFWSLGHWQCLVTNFTKSLIKARKSQSASEIETFATGLQTMRKIKQKNQSSS